MKLTDFTIELDNYKFTPYTEASYRAYHIPISEIDGITIGSNVTNIESLLESDTKLLKDFAIPTHITNCTNCFKGCTSMTRVHSNWKNTYTNGITSTDCYAGCIGIIHIDGEGISSGTGLDYIPTDWGGNGSKILSGMSVEERTLYLSNLDNTENDILSIDSKTMSELTEEQIEVATAKGYTLVGV